MIYVYTQKYTENTQGIPKTGHVTGRLLLAAGLRELYGLKADEEDPEHMLSYGKRGKPCLKDCRDIHFNISHCRKAAACAFSESPVGIDMESSRKISQAVAERTMTSDELDMLSQYGTDERKYTVLFLRLWTLKESLAKFAGTGMTKEICRISFKIDPYDITKLPICSRHGVHFWQGTIFEDCIVSVCSGKEVHPDDIDLRPVT